MKIAECEESSAVLFLSVCVLYKVFNYWKFRASLMLLHEAFHIHDGAVLLKTELRKTILFF